MTHLVDSAFTRARVVMLMMVTLIVFGTISFFTIPREAEPDVPLPFASVTIPLPGISAEDGERLLVKPSETELQSLENLMEMDATSYEGAANIILEFKASSDMDQVLVDVREAIDRAKSNYPDETLEPIITEFNTQTMNPVLSVLIYGSAPERAIFDKAKGLQNRILGLTGVLEANLAGARDELLEIIVDPDTLETYGISEQEIANALRQNNALIVAGSITFEDGSYSVKVPGLIKTTREAEKIPVRSDGETVITLGDIAELRRTFEAKETSALINNQPAIGINITKRSGANIVQLTEDIKALVDTEAKYWPSTMQILYIGDESKNVSEILSSLTSSIILAVVLVMILVVAALGFRSAILVGFAIPASFLTGMVLLNFSGYSFNMMTMFSMVLAVGMLVDSAIVIVEYSDRRMLEGVSRVEAFKSASKRMFWPIIASTATTLAAFVPFLFWKTNMGEFMKFLPITLIFILSSSLVVALIFLPLVGSYARLPSFFKEKFGMKGKTDQPAIVDLDNIDPTTLPNATGKYARFIKWMTLRPLRSMLLAALVILFCQQFADRSDIDFALFPLVDQEKVQILVQARGNLSPKDELRLAKEVEATIQGHSAIKNIYTQTGGSLGREQNTPAETIALLTIELIDYSERVKSNLIMDEFRILTKSVPGVVIEITQEDAGPPIGKDVQLEIKATNFEEARRATNFARKFMEQSTSVINDVEVATFMDIEDNQPLPGIEWVIDVDREQAGLYGVSVAEIGSMLQLVTDGLLVDKFRPNDADEEIDVRIRFPEEDRTLTALSNLRIQTRDGPLPISNFVTRKPVPQVDRVIRRDSARVMDLRANGNSTLKGHEVSQSDAITVMSDWLATGTLDEEFNGRVNAQMVGTTEEADEAASFFTMAMASAMFMIGVILLLQFNSFYHAALTLSAVVLSVVGVFFGIALSGQIFAIITSGVGIVALAGIVVNNNIVLIDTFHHLRRTGLPVVDAVVRTAAQRVRPVLLTTATTILGLLPMVFQISVNFGKGTVGIGNSVSGWWVELASAIVFGLAFSTLLTLIFTPIMLAMPTILGENFKQWTSGKTSPLNGRPRRPFKPELGRTSSPKASRKPRNKSVASDDNNPDYHTAAE